MSCEPCVVRPSSRRAGFTLIELLVVISIIALLIGILIPVLGIARNSARSAQSLSNLRQLGIAMQGYVTEHNLWFPMHSSPNSWNPRTRWADYLFAYVSVETFYLSPMLTSAELTRFDKPFAHSVGGEEKYHGGYGYNFQYLGNARYLGHNFNDSFHARMDMDVRSASRTVILGDTAGSRGGNAANTPGHGGEAVYALDPPLPGLWTMGTWGTRRGYAVNSQRAHPAGNRAYYAGASVAEPTGNADTYLYRSFPAERNLGSAGMVFGDGHGRQMAMDEIDDSNDDGTKDNGFWNGHGRADLQ